MSLSVMGYYNNNSGCLAILAIPFFAAWYVVKFLLAIVACCLVVPVRIIWLLITIPAHLFTGEDHTNDWADADFMAGMWHVFFPEK